MRELNEKITSIVFAITTREVKTNKTHSVSVLTVIDDGFIKKVIRFEAPQFLHSALFAP